MLSTNFKFPIVLQTSMKVMCINLSGPQPPNIKLIEQIVFLISNTWIIIMSRLRVY
jgi:hypothetical protein